MRGTGEAWNSMSFNPSPTVPDSDKVPVGGLPQAILVDGSPLKESEAALNATPLSRVWVFTWALLTWIFTFAFFVLLATAFTFNISDGARTYTRSDTFTRSLGCIYKTPWSDWASVRDKYTTLIPTTPVISLSGSNDILDSVMRAMRCHGNLPTQATGPLAGGVQGVVSGTDTVSTMSFDFSSKACHCAHKLHTEVYYPSYANATTREQVVALGNTFFSDGVGSPPRSIVKECVFTSRVGHEVEVDDSCFLSVSPYMVVLYTNTVAGIFAALYLLHPAGNNNKEGWMYRVLSNKISAGVFIVINLALGITGMVISRPSDSTVGVLSTVMALALLGVVSMIYIMVNQEGVADTTIVARVNLKDNFVVIQRISFWFQYIITLPGNPLEHARTHKTPP